jgi:hypothetical protein
MFADYEHIAHHQPYLAAYAARIPSAPVQSCSNPNVHSLLTSSTRSCLSVQQMHPLDSSTTSSSLCMSSVPLTMSASMLISAMSLTKIAHLPTLPTPGSDRKRDKNFRACQTRFIPETLLVFQNVREQCGLSGAEETCTTCQVLR